MRHTAAVIIFASTFFYCTILSGLTSKAQGYQITTDKDGTKILKGLLTRADIESDTSFKWFQQNYKQGQANTEAVEAFEKNAGKFQLVVFAGTWCEDTQNLLPVMYRLLDKSGYASQDITLVGVDRAKTTLDNLHNAFHITEVPTFIIMKDGKELGRIVEYGKYGQVDKELGEIVNTIQ